MLLKTCRTYISLYVVLYVCALSAPYGALRGLLYDAWACSPSRSLGKTIRVSFEMSAWCVARSMRQIASSAHEVADSMQ